MISIVIPTRNRAYTLEKVLPSYYNQKMVSQIVFVNDASTDQTEKVIGDISKHYPNVETALITNECKQGAAFSRNRGVNAATNEYVLFGEDDAYLEDNYCEVLLNKFKSSSDSVGIVSGRLIQLAPQEEKSLSIERFGNGNPKNHKTFNYHTCSHVADAYFERDIFLPLTHALILTKKELLKKYPYDTYYSKGNAFREESDFQMHAFTEGVKILVTNDTHCMHLHPSDVKKGGHRISHLQVLWYKIYYTHYFYRKYYKALRQKCRLPLPRSLALLTYTGIQIKEFSFAVFSFLRKKFRNQFLTRKV